MEIVDDLTSSSFIAALRRFMARRGKPRELWSNNGTNFVGAHRELTIYLRDIKGSTAEEGIVWKFNPRPAPQFGGIWESTIKSAKYILARALKQAKLTLAELQKLLC